MHPLNKPESDPKLPLEDLLKGNTGFVVPENYMDNLSDRVVSNILMDKNLHRISPENFNIPENYFEEFPDRLFDKLESDQLPGSLKQNPFKVPENYFENKILNIEKLVQNKESKIIVKTNFKRVWSFAAAACVLLLVSWIGIRLFSNPKPVDYLSNITEDELLEYVSIYASDFDESSLASVINENEINSLNILDVDMDDETSDLLIQILE